MRRTPDAHVSLMRWPLGIVAVDDDGDSWKETPCDSNCDMGAISAGLLGMWCISSCTGFLGKLSVVCDNPSVGMDAPVTPCTEMVGLVDGWRFGLAVMLMGLPESRTIEARHRCLQYCCVKSAMLMLRCASAALRLCMCGGLVVEEILFVKTGNACAGAISLPPCLA